MINLWGIILTLAVFIGVLKLKHVKFIGSIPPTVIVGIVLIAILNIFKLDYKSYNESACLLTLLLGPATIALAYPLAENLELLTKNKRAIYFGILVATTTALVVGFVLGKLFHSDMNIITSLLPKSVTTPIAVEISRVIGGIPELTACIVGITGIYGALFGHQILKFLKIKSDIAIGLSIGAASHVLGTSTCTNKKRQVVMATLALIITGILTSIFCICLFR